MGKDRTRCPGWCAPGDSFPFGLALLTPVRRARPPSPLPFGAARGCRPSWGTGGASRPGRVPFQVRPGLSCAGVGCRRVVGTRGMMPRASRVAGRLPHWAPGLPPAVPPAQVTLRSGAVPEGAGELVLGLGHWLGAVQSEAACSWLGLLLAPGRTPRRLVTYRPAWLRGVLCYQCPLRALWGRPRPSAWLGAAAHVPASRVRLWPRQRQRLRPNATVAPAWGTSRRPGRGAHRATG